MPSSKTNQIISAIKQNGHIVTEPEIARSTGLSMYDVSLELKRIAFETGGHMRVSDRGELTYVFPRALNERYLARGLQGFLLRMAAISQSAIASLIRLSFGIMLIFCTIIVTLFLVALSSLFRAGSTGRNESELDLGVLDPAIWLLILTNRTRNSRLNALASKGSFLLDCHQFVFGPGDPNKNLEEKKWLLISKTIQESGGLVICEELAPYSEAALDDEDAMLPILVRFEGLTEVSEEGYLLYNFTKLMSSDKIETLEDSKEKDNGPGKRIEYSSNGIDTERSIEYLHEQNWKQFALSNSSIFSISMLVIFNLMAGAILMLVVGAPFLELIMLGKAQPSFLIFATFAPFIYALFMMTIPFLRFTRNLIINRLIESRNVKRKLKAKQLGAPDHNLARKLEAARKRREELTAEKLLELERKAIYTTEKDVLEQESL